MSDEINTQHGTIGLLMAECEQLRRDKAILQKQLERLVDARDAERLRANKLNKVCDELAMACQSIVSPIRPHWRDTLERASKAIQTYNDLSIEHATTK